MWDKKTLEKHRRAALMLDKIKDAAFKFIGQTPNVSEYDVHRFILQQYKKHKMRTDDNRTIVAFDENSAQPHYYPDTKTAKRLKPNTFILIDIWARYTAAHSPFADITWVGFYGNESKIPKKIKTTVALAFKARDNALNFLQKELQKKEIPSGKDVDNISNQTIIKAGFKKNILHTTGHSIGFDSPHGLHPHISQRGIEILHPNLAYTIEPGIYFEKHFGVRTEIDFYFDEKLKLHITTPMQHKLLII